MTVGERSKPGHRNRRCFHSEPVADLAHPRAVNTCVSLSLFPKVKILYSSSVFEGKALKGILSSTVTSDLTLPLRLGLCTGYGTLQLNNGEARLHLFGLTVQYRRNAVRGLTFRPVCHLHPMHRRRSGVTWYKGDNRSPPGDRVCLRRMRTMPQ